MQPDCQMNVLWFIRKMCLRNPDLPSLHQNDLLIYSPVKWKALAMNMKLPRIRFRDVNSKVYIWKTLFLLNEKKKRELVSLKWNG